MEHESEPKADKFSFFAKNNKPPPDNIKAITYSKNDNKEHLRIDLNEKSPLPKLPENMPKPPESPVIMKRNVIISYLTYFLNRRPPIEQLKKQGIIQG